jgi:hypothetical protein
MPLLILMQSSRTTQVTWSSQDTAMHHTYPIKGTQPGGWAFLHVQQHSQTTKQWHHPHNCTDYQGDHVLGSRGQGGGSLHQLQRSHFCPPYPQIHGPSPTSNPNADGQHHCTQRCQQQYIQEIESNGHEVPLAPRQRMSRTISTQLGPRQREQRQLRDKTSCHNSSPSDMPNLPHKYIYLTSTTPITQPTTHRQTSCSKGVLDIYYTTVWYNLHTYSKLPDESLLVPLFVLGQT